MIAKIPFDATLLDLTGSRDQQCEYVRRVLANFHGPNVDRSITKVRMGVVGSGHSPHYRLDFPTEAIYNGKTISINASVVFNGTNHKEMVAFAAEQIREEHWSSKTMTYQGVADLLGRLRKNV